MGWVFFPLLPLSYFLFKQICADLSAEDGGGVGGKGYGVAFIGACKPECR